MPISMTMAYQYSPKTTELWNDNEKAPRFSRAQPYVPPPERNEAVMPTGWSLPGRPTAAVATVGDEWMENEEQWREKEELRTKLIEEQRLAEELKKKNLARHEKAWQERRKQYEEKERKARLNASNDRKNRLNEMARGMPRWREWTRAPGQRLVRTSNSPPGFISSSDMLFTQPRPATALDLEPSSRLASLSMGETSNAFSSAMRSRPALHVRQRPAFALDGPAFALPPTPKQAP